MVTIEVQRYNVCITLLSDITAKKELLKIVKDSESLALRNEPSTSGQSKPSTSSGNLHTLRDANYSIPFLDKPVFISFFLMSLINIRFLDFCFIFFPEHKQDCEYDSDSDHPLVVSVTYPWHHPLTEMLGLYPPSVYVPGDIQDWDTGSNGSNFFEDLTLALNSIYGSNEPIAIEQIAIEQIAIEPIVTLPTFP